MTAKVTVIASPKEVTISPAATVNVGQMYVHNDTNGVAVPSTTQTASAFATAIGATAVKTVDYPARVGHFPSTGFNIFETLGVYALLVISSAHFIC